jgi:hypothetical protein
MKTSRFTDSQIMAIFNDECHYLQEGVHFIS